MAVTSRDDETKHSKQQWDNKETGIYEIDRNQRTKTTHKGCKDKIVQTLKIEVIDHGWVAGDAGHDITRMPGLDGSLIVP